MFDCQQSPIFFINSWRFCLTQISSKKTLIFSIKSWFVLFSRWFFTLICFNYRPFQCLWWWFETVSVSTNRPCFYSHHFFWFQDILDCNKSSGPPGGGAAASWIGGFQTFFALSLVCAFKVTTWWVHQEKQRFFFCSVYLFQSVWNLWRLWWSGGRWPSSRVSWRTQWLSLDIQKVLYTHSVRSFIYKV